MQVTDKMVEAGAKKLYEMRHLTRWETIGGAEQDEYRVEARAMLRTVVTLAAALSDQERAEGKWHRVDRSAGSVLLYTLREEGRRRGEPGMVNDVMINIDRGSGSTTDIEPIVQRIRSALADGPVDAEAVILADLVERCKEIFARKKTGILPGEALRTQAKEIRERFNNVFDAGEALRQAEALTSARPHPKHDRRRPWLGT